MSEQVTVTTDADVQLAVTVDGDPDGPAVVLLHGITMSHRSWDWVVPLIGATHRLIRPDARGHGDSERVPDGYLLDGFVADAIAVIEQVAGGPCVLVGHSLGGVTAAAVAQQRPDLVRALLMEDPALALARPTDGPPGGPVMDGFRSLRRDAPEAQQQGTSEADYATRLAGVSTAFGVPAGERYTIDALDAWAHGHLHLDVRALDPLTDPASSNLGPAFDIDEGLTVPTTVLAADLGSPDRVSSRTDERRLTAASDDLTWIRIDGGGHYLHDEKNHRPVVAEHLLAVASDG